MILSLVALLISCLPGCLNAPESANDNTALEKPVFVVNMLSSIGAQPGFNDSAHQEIKYHITLTNQSDETVKNVRVLLSTIAVNQEQKPLIFEKPLADHPDFAADDSGTFDIAWNYDGSGRTKEEIISLVDQTIITVKYITLDGREASQPVYPRNP
jgi:hypothetical protein